MSPEEIEKQINRIAWGAKYISAKNQYDEDITVILRSLSLQDKNFIDFIFNKAKDSARELGIYSKLELINELKRRDIWTEKDDAKLDEIRTSLRSLYEDEQAIKGGKLKRIKRAIMFTEDTLRELMHKKNALFNNTIEKYAEEQKTLAIVYCSVYDEYNEKMWCSWKDFLSCPDILFIRSILLEINSDLMLTTKSMRLIARNTHWRFRWTAAKNVGDLFGKPILELDVEQQSLIYWTQVYDSVYEAYERPSQSIIDDDEALDKWFEEQDKKAKTQQLENSGQVGKLKVSEKVMRHGEVFIVANHSSNPDSKFRQKAPHVPSIQEIADLNDSMTKAFKKKELEKIKEKGIINEKDLRHRKNKIARKIIGSKAGIINRNNMSGHARGSNKRIVPGENIS